MNLLQELAADALRDAGIPGAEPPNMDGRLHRYKADRDKEADSWYCFHQSDNFAAGAFGCWRRQLNQKWCSKSKSEFTKAEWASYTEAIKKSEAERKAESERLQVAAREKCKKLFATAPAAKAHPYLSAKQVKPVPGLCLSNLEQFPGWLAVPLVDENNTVHSCQFIAEDGAKKFMFGGRVAGCFFPIHTEAAGPLVLCEGVATGLTIHAATHWPVLCAMNCGNLKAVAVALRAQFLNRTIVIAADNDQFTIDPVNPGLTKAKEAAKAIDAKLACPDFTAESLPEKPTDFNDLQQIEGLGEVARQLAAAFSVIARPIGEAKIPPIDDPLELIRYRFLCRRGSLLVSGPSGMGKSSFMIQCFACWANGLPAFGLMPRSPMRIVFIQAENDDGDIAEMRDGICHGLNLTNDQIAVFHQNVQFFTTNGQTGKLFTDEVVRPILDLHAPDLLGIDPALSFLGGDFKNQEIVGGFLRNMLNPQLFEHNCSAMLMHHTNKPLQGKEKAEWRNGELAYLGGGSQEFTNWARAILGLQSTGEHGIYKLHASKRGNRTGWTDHDQNPAYEKLIAHSQERGKIYWEEREIDPADDQNGDVPRGTGSTPGRKSKVDEIAFSNLHEFCASLPEGGDGKAEAARRLESFLAKNKQDASESTCLRVIEKLVETGKLTKGQDFRYYCGPEA